MLDVHTHFFPRHLTPPAPGAVDEGWPVPHERGDEIDVLQGGRVVRTLGVAAWDATARLRAMDELEVERQVVMPTPFTFLYDIDEELAVTYCRAQNDALAELVDAGGGRLVGLAALPLGSPAEAAQEVARVRDDLGLAGVEIGTHAGGRQLHDEELDPVFDALERSSSSVFVHPWSPVAPTRTSHHGLAFALGRAVETEIAVGSLVFGGRLDRNPDLRVCLAHGGAGIPSLIGRFDNGWQRQDPQSRYPRAEPAVALRRLWVDGLTYDAQAVALTERVFGRDRVVVGSDFPFAAQESPIGASLAEAANRSLLQMSADWRKQTERNALDFLGLAS